MPKRENTLKSGKKQNRINKRREEAIARNSAWEALTSSQKISSLDKRGVAAKKQRAKIISEMTKTTKFSPKLNQPRNGKL